VTRLLAAIDDSEAAGRVASAAAQLAGRMGWQLDLVHVVENGHARAVAAAGAHPLRLVRGSPAAVLADELEAPDVAMAVIGAREDRDDPRPAGHIATELLLDADKPVVVVPPDGEGPPTLGRVLVPLDGTEETARALEPVLRLCDDAGLETLVLHVFDRTTAPAFWDQPQHCNDGWTDEFVARFSPRARAMHLRAGTPGDHVVSVATSEGADMLLLAWSRRLTPGRARCVRETLRQAHVPVLLVPVHRGEEAWPPSEVDRAALTTE
jgi:nucleotide-binding universal stress UspA family protein